MADLSFYRHLPEVGRKLLDLLDDLDDVHRQIAALQENEAMLERRIHAAVVDGWSAEEIQAAHDAANAPKKKPGGYRRRK